VTANIHGGLDLNCDSDLKILVKFETFYKNFEKKKLNFFKIRICHVGYSLTNEIDASDSFLNDSFLTGLGVLYKIWPPEKDFFLYGDLHIISNLEM